MSSSPAASPSGLSTATLHASHAGPVPARCPNCGAGLELSPSPNYCPNCGQETTLHPPSVAEFAHEFVGHYVALEGPLWRTLRLLCTRPGQLTREYLHGRRRRYVLPLRLYLSASFLFFLLFKLLAPAPTPVVLTADPRLDSPAVVVTVPGFGSHAGDRAVDCGRASEAACSWIEKRANGIVARWHDDPQHNAEEFEAHWIGAAPYAVFLMLPAFAAVVALAYRSRRMLFGEHLVFGLHLHAFAFLAGAVAVIIPFADLVAQVAIPVYSVVALRTVYGGRWSFAILRAVAVALLYGVLLTIASSVLALALV